MLVECSLRHLLHRYFDVQMRSLIVYDRSFGGLCLSNSSEELVDKQKERSDNPFVAIVVIILLLLLRVSGQGKLKFLTPK